VFWEMLGRVVGTYGFLEEIISKAIFCFTATKTCPEGDLDIECEKWLRTLERSLYETLSPLVELYAKSVREHPRWEGNDFDCLVDRLKEAAVIRNILCHGSWRAPDEQGACLPLFVNRKKETFDASIDLEFLCRTQSAVAELACAVINTVTAMGWQFPGSQGPGAPIWQSDDAGSQ
jgi:hypothetical protein